MADAIILLTLIQSFSTEMSPFRTQAIRPPPRLSEGRDRRWVPVLPRQRAQSEGRGRLGSAEQRGAAGHGVPALERAQSVVLQSHREAGDGSGDAGARGPWRGCKQDHVAPWQDSAHGLLIALLPRV